jgi:hypothetical protein
VASRTIRRAFWLLSTGLHLWAVNASAISTAAVSSEGLPDLNWALQRSQMPRAGVVRFTIRNLRLAMHKV